jgi:hypothetical protein
MKIPTTFVAGIFILLKRGIRTYLIRYIRSGRGIGSSVESKKPLIFKKVSLFERECDIMAATPSKGAIRHDFF